MILSITAQLPQWLDNFSTDLGTLWPIVLFIGAAYGLVKWISKKFKDEVKELIVSEVEPIKAELSNNGGSSVKDAIDRLDENYGNLKENVSGIKKDMDEMRSDIAQISKKAQDDHKVLSEKINKIEEKNDFILEEMIKRRPALDALESKMLKDKKNDF